MTLIECFDRVPAENIMSCLRLRPEKLIFLGTERSRIPEERYRKVLAGRNINTRISVRSVPGDDLNSMTAALSDIVRQESQCVIDVTGGDDTILMAVGAMYAGLDAALQKKVAIQRFDMEYGATGDLDGDGEVLAGEDALLTASELITLQGGTVHPRVRQPDKHYTPGDLQPLWELARKNPKDWNQNVPILREFENRSRCDTQVLLSLRDLSGTIGQFEEKRERYQNFLRLLSTCGAIDDRSTGDVIHYSYPDPLLRGCLEKAGNILEMKTLLEARSLLCGGRPYFHDCQMSVHIDWDGVLHDPAQRIPETRNEIDLILMHGMTPLFVSCKNGSIPEDELYKLHTVAQRFGSRYAKKMLIATDLERKNSFSDEAFIQRARDMGIYLVTNAAKLSHSQWKYHLRRAAEF